MSDVIYAHTLEGEGPESWQTLSEHLGNVAEKSGEFAASFGYRQWGYTIGLLHDAGKVDPAFQRRLMDSHAPSFDHAAMGAVLAHNRYGKKGYCVMPFAIAGHHGGMPNGIEADESLPDGGRPPLRTRLEKADTKKDENPYAAVLESAGLALPSQESLEPLFPERDVRELAASPNNRVRDHMNFSVSVRARMLFSCLVDADYLDTERFVTPELAEARDSRVRASLKELAELLDVYMEELAGSAKVSLVNEGRARVLSDCRAAAELAPGIFKLTVPTGGGKTLASLSFALHHAVRNRLQRVICAIPFTSIVEQTADTFRKVLGDENVLEHHSNYDFDVHDGERALRERLAVQNWDAPVIVTTNVQLLESLFSNKPSRCRKLHNIANSVIVLDEAQTLPNQLLRVSLAMLEELVRNYGVTIVLCTATQPEVDELWPFDSTVREIVADHEGLSRCFKARTAFAYEGDIGEEGLATKLAECGQVLCIVDTKAKARELYQDVVARCRESGTVVGDSSHEEGIFHLSANMTPVHRSLWIDAIRRRLHDGEQCVVISTQLIEAGVDVDFPVVWREVAGLDSLVQAAGRCNREGRRPGVGIVHVFDFEAEDSTSAFRPLGLGAGWLRQTADITRDLIKKHGGALAADMVGEYFGELYAREGELGLDAKGLYGSLCDARLPQSRYEALEFESYANAYRIIDKDEVPIFVPWGSEGQRMLGELKEFCSLGNPAAAMARKLQRFSVGIPRWRVDEYCKQGLVDAKTYAPIYVLCQEENCEKQYDDETGLLEVGKGVPDVLVC